MRIVLRIFLGILLLAAFIALALVGLPGPLYRVGLIHLGTAFGMIFDGAWIGIVAGIVAILLIFGAAILREKRGILYASGALVACAIAFGIPYLWLKKAQSVPPIHDITTDPQHPPSFRAILRTHPFLVNSPVYGGGSPEAAQQEVNAVTSYLKAIARGHGPKAAEATKLLPICEHWGASCLGRITRVFYPRVRPLIVHDVSVTTAVRIARTLMVDRGWKLVPTQRRGRLEAVARTPWFGFRDDVALRITPLPHHELRIDMRSESRIGLSDIGRNAHRIHSFLEKLAHRLARHSKDRKS